MNGPGNFEDFAVANPELADKSLLLRWYGPERLASDAARPCAMTPMRLLLIYRWTFAGLIVIASVETLMTEGRASLPIAVLASVEIVAALLFVWRRSQVAGMIALLVAFAVAQAITMMMGQLQTHFLQYAASTVLVVSLDRALARNARVQSI